MLQPASSLSVSAAVRPLLNRAQSCPNCRSRPIAGIGSCPLSGIPGRQPHPGSPERSDWPHV